MPAWCTPAEVDALVKGDPPAELLQEYANHAASALYVMSGRRFAGESTVTAQFQVNRRGRVVLTSWLPVRSIVDATRDGAPINVVLSPGGTYAQVGLLHVNQIVELTLAVGQNPPEMGRRAAAALAAELLREDPRYATLGADDVRPTSRLTSISRQGVTYTYADPTQLAQSNMTGISEVDLFVRSVNPSGAQYQPKVVTT
jgi:hypothetical protein